MKSAPLCLALLLTSNVMSATPASKKFSSLVGKWNGHVERNQKNDGAGGNPSEGETGTPVTIQFTQTEHGLEGQSRLGKITEKWDIKHDPQLNKDIYVFSDDVIEVNTVGVDYKKLPKWIKSELDLKPSDHVFAFKFESCLVKKTNAKCKAPDDYPVGLEETGYWVFKVQANQLTSNVVYQYPNGRKRILSESLKKE